MPNKKTLLFVLLGWIIAAFFPPQAAIGLVKGRS